MKSASFSFLTPFAVVLCCAFLLSCGNDPNDPGSGLSGVLSGKVILEDAYGVELSDKSGAVIEVEGTSFRTETEADGSWRFGNLPAGTYVLKFSKGGFTHRKIFGYQFVGGGEAYFPEVYLTTLPAQTISNLTAMVTDTIHVRESHNPHDTSIVRSVEPYVRFAATINHPAPTGNNLRIYAYVGTSADVSYRPGTYDVHIYIGQSDTLSGVVLTSNAPLLKKRYASGERVYMVMYPAAHGTHGGEYEDKQLGYEVDADVVDAPSNVVSVVMP